MRVDPKLARSYLDRTDVLRVPKRRLSTFGATTIAYQLISDADEMENKARLREGVVRSEKPKILTPEAFAERFKGFGEESAQLFEWLAPEYRDLLRALEYNFKNEGFRTSVISETPQQVASRVLGELDARGAEDKAVIRCPDGGWALALMKFTLDEAARSFPVQVRDLERRGLFDPAGKALGRRRKEIEKLFEAARSDASARESLGTKLKEWGLFEEYEDRFLALFS